MNYSKHIEQNQPIHLISTRDEHGVDCYFLLRASKANYMKLTAQLNKAPINIADYGEILQSGFGKKPNRHKAAELQEKYGIIFDA